MIPDEFKNRSVAKKIIHHYPDGMVGWRYETAEDRLMTALEENGYKPVERSVCTKCGDLVKGDTDGICQNCV